MLSPMGTPDRSDAARLLHPSRSPSTPLDTSVLCDIAGGLARVVESDQAAAPWELQSTRLLTTEAYDAWLMVWGPAALSAAHDHDGSVGVVQVVAGNLLETSLGIEASLPTPLRRLGPGDTVEFSATEFHSLFNPTSGTTVTVNVYSPPLGDGSAHDPSDAHGAHAPRAPELDPSQDDARGSGPIDDRGDAPAVD